MKAPSAIFSDLSEKRKFPAFIKMALQKMGNKI